MLTDGHECGATATISDNTLHSALVGLFYGQRASPVSGVDYDGGAIEGWGTGRDNAWHSNCISDLSPGVLNLGTRCKHNSRSLLAS